MTTTQERLVGRVPEFELCDRMRRSLRLVPELDNSAVAERMGVRRETVSTWLGGRRRPSVAVLTLWAQMTGVDLAWLVTGVAEGSELPRLDSNQQPFGYASSQVSRSRLVLAA